MASPEKNKIFHKFTRPHSVFEARFGPLQLARSKLSLENPVTVLTLNTENFSLF